MYGGVGGEGGKKEYKELINILINIFESKVRFLMLVLTKIIVVCLIGPLPRPYNKKKVKYGSVITNYCNLYEKYNLLEQKARAQDIFIAGYGSHLPWCGKPISNK